MELARSIKLRVQIDPRTYPVSRRNGRSPSKPGRLVTSVGVASAETKLQQCGGAEQKQRQERKTSPSQDACASMVWWLDLANFA
jgi:hypothetical protein